jgi:hypothetical protein
MAGGICRTGAGMSAPQPELLPCPFCAGVAKSWDIGAAQGNKPRWLIECFNSECSVLVEAETRTEADSIAAWNTRAPCPKAQALADALRALGLDKYATRGGSLGSVIGNLPITAIHNATEALAAWDAKP